MNKGIFGKMGNCSMIEKVSQILFDLTVRFGSVQFVPQKVGGMLCMVVKVSFISRRDEVSV